MAIKSDRWIREMSENHGMIEPYAETKYVMMKQVKNSSLMAYLVMVMMYVVHVNSKYLLMCIP